MEFKSWLHNQDTETFEKEEASLMEIAKEFSLENSLPKPVSYLNEGAEAIVFNTTNPNVVVRITKGDSEASCEKIMLSPTMQKSGAVVKILKSNNYKNHYITYKEKVDTEWENYLQNKNPKNVEEITNDLENIVFDFADHDEYTLKKRIKNLSNFKETKKLAIAISRFPQLMKDLHVANIGVNKEGDLVIIDC